MQQSLWGKKLLLLVTSCFLMVIAVAQNRFSPSDYIKEHKTAAQQLMRETGVPASVILAVAMHESAHGNSRIAVHLNNHFGIKGKNNSKTIKSAYKGYTSVSSSYDDFIDLLKRRKSTQPLFGSCSSVDYKSWIRGIARSGYSHSKDWSSKVLATISRHALNQYDELL